jgi:S-adenosylhomocysteine hydrolase
MATADQEVIRTDSGLKITRTELGDVEVNIKDEYYLHLNDADCVRTITYRNKASVSVPVKLSNLKCAFFPTFEGFRATVGNEDKTDLLTETLLDYTKLTNVFYDAEIGPEEILTLSITCNSKNFVSLVDDSFFSFTFPEKATYELILHGFNAETHPFVCHINDKRAEKDRDFRSATDSLSFRPISLGKNEPLQIRLLRLSTPAILPTFHFFSRLSKGKQSPLSGLIIILIQHLLSDSIHLVHGFFKNGVPKNDIFIVGIPYSTKAKTVKYLKIERYDNLYTPDNYPFDDIVRSMINIAIQHSKSAQKKILIVEDGGYVVPLLHKEYLREAELFVGAVEQTANGIWRDEDIFEKDHIDYQIPIIDVARSPLKTRLESPLIGRAVCNNIQLLLGREFIEISGREVGIVGFGNTGSRIAKNLADLGAKVTIYSNSYIDLNFAHNEGYRIEEQPEALIGKCRVIIEATGQEWARAKEIAAFQDGSYFINASSKRLGIDYDNFLGMIDESKTQNILGVGARYELTTGKRVTLLADGFPINFFASESVPDKAIDFIPTLLFGSAKLLAEKQGSVKNGIVGFSYEKQEPKEMTEFKKLLLDLQERIAEMHLNKER